MNKSSLLLANMAVAAEEVITFDAIDEHRTDDKAWTTVTTKRRRKFIVTVEELR